MKAKILHNTNLLIHNFLSLLYPSFCAGCDNPLLRNESLICTHCLSHLPETKFIESPERTEMAKLFWGRIQIQNAISFYYFHKESIFQRIVHEFKYRQRKDIGVFFGRFMGEKLNTKKIDFDVIVPVPIDKKKKVIRGYNQSEILAQEISEVTGIPLKLNILARKQTQKTQTKRARFDRWMNVADSFYIKPSDHFNYRHVLLVDDVVTTGATLEACAIAIMEKWPVKISVLTLAIADNF